MVKCDDRSADECIAKGVTKYAIVAGYPSSSNQMIREPAAAARVKVVVTHAVATRRGVNETSVTSVYRDVTDLSALLEEKQVADGQRAGGNGDTRSSHLARRPRQIHTILPVYVLNKAR